MFAAGAQISLGGPVSVEIVLHKNAIYEREVFKVLGGYSIIKPKYDFLKGNCQWN